MVRAAWDILAPVGALGCSPRGTCRTCDLRLTGIRRPVFKVRRGALHLLRRFVPCSLVAAGALAVGAIGAAPASAAPQMVNCSGNAFGCVATVSISGGASNKTVVVRLTDTDLFRAGTRVTPKSSKGAFSISNGHFAVGGSEWIFTLNAVKANPHGSRIILLFAAGFPA
jgi:hypothetical protein